MELLQQQTPKAWEKKILNNMKKLLFIIILIGELYSQTVLKKGVYVNYGNYVSTYMIRIMDGNKFQYCASCYKGGEKNGTLYYSKNHDSVAFVFENQLMVKYRIIDSTSFVSDFSVKDSIFITFNQDSTSNRFNMNVFDNYQLTHILNDSNQPIKTVIPNKSIEFFYNKKGKILYGVFINEGKSVRIKRKDFDKYFLDLCCWQI